MGNNKWKSSPTKGDYLFNTEALALTLKRLFVIEKQNQYAEKTTPAF